jgi:integrase
LRVGTWANEYLEEAQARFVAKTFEEKRSVFARFFEATGLCPHTPIQNLSVAICRRYLIAQFKARSGYAANKDRKNLGTAWNWGRDHVDGWPQGRNPFLVVRKFPERRKPRYVPPEEDFWKVYEVAEGQDKVMLMAFLHMAARRTEVFRLKWSDLDVLEGRIRLWTRKREGGHREFDWVPMTKELKGVMLGWREYRLSVPSLDDKHVFVCLDRYPLCDAYYGKPFKHRQHLMKRLCKRAKVEPFGFHAIRHLTASILYRKGYPVSVIQALLRHKNPNTTARYLRSLGLEDMRDALEDVFKGPAQLIPFPKAATTG